MYDTDSSVLQKICLDKQLDIFKELSASQSILLCSFGVIAIIYCSHLKQLASLDCAIKFLSMVKPCELYYLHNPMQVWQFMALEKLFHLYMTPFSEVTITALLMISHLRPLPCVNLKCRALHGCALKK